MATSKGRFYPDFVAELTDGRVAVIEYKGAHLVGLASEIEKRQVGELWAKLSSGKCMFGQVVLQREGMNMQQQINALFS